jgi:hypothetical protein
MRREGAAFCQGKFFVMTTVISFDDAMTAAGAKDCSLLLGNGFSARYFNYRSLLDNADLNAETAGRMLESCRDRHFHRRFDSAEANSPSPRLVRAASVGYSVSPWTR